MSLRLALAALVLLLGPPSASARPTTIVSPPAEPVATQPLLVDMTATIAVRGRADAGAPVDVSARCSLRPCITRAYANRRGRWRALLHVVVPPSRRVLFVRAGEATQQIRLAPPVVASGTPELAVIGDSLAQGFSSYLPELLPGWRITVDAARSRFLAEGMAVRETMRLPSRRPVVLAFSLFTNDHPSRAAELAAWARQSLDGLPRGSCVVWGAITRPKVDGISYAQANALLEQVAAEDHDGRRFIVAPWADAAREHREWLRRDRVHATAEGYRALAELYASAARSCPL